MVPLSRRLTLIVGATALVAASASPAFAQEGDFAEQISHAQGYVDGTQNYETAKVTYSGDPIEVRFSSFVSDAAKSLWVPWQGAFKQLEKESAGKLSIKAYPGGVLHSARDGFKAVRDGISDLSHCYASYQPKSFKLMHAFGLPGLFPNSPVASQVGQELYAKYFKKEFEALGVYMARGSFTPSYNIISKKPVHKLEDLKGLKARTTGGIQANMYSAAGGIPIFVPSSESYTAFQRGTVDAVVGHDAAFIIFRTAEAAKHWTKIGFANVQTSLCMRPGFFDELPDDLKTVFYNWLQRWNQVDAQVYYEKAAFGARDTMKNEMGIEFYTPPDEERQRIIDAMSVVIGQFEEEMAKEGLPGREAVAAIRETTKKYSQMTWNEIFDQVANEPTQGIVDF